MMKKLLTILLAITVLAPSVTFGAIGVGFNATSTSAGIIFPNLVNGVLQAIGGNYFTGAYFNATSTTATSTFLGKLKLGTYPGVPQLIGPDEDTGLHFDGPDIMSFHTGGTQRVLINASGNVGIATSAPYRALSVAGDMVSTNIRATSSIEIGSTTSSLHAAGALLKLSYESETAGGAEISVVNHSTADNRGGFSFIRTEGSAAFPTAVSSGDRLGFFGFKGYDGTSAPLTALVEGYVDGTVTTGAVPARLAFVTGSTGANRAERLSISSTGNIGLSTTTPQTILDIASSSPTLRISNTTQSLSAGATYGDIDFYSSDATLRGVVTRIRAKTNDGNLGGDGEMSFWTTPGGGSLTERMRLLTSGGLAIGSTTARTRLQVHDSTTSSVAIGNLISSSAPFITGTNVLHIRYDSTIDAGIIQASTTPSTSRRILINPDGGNVGVGTTSPFTRFAVNGTIAGSNYLATSTTATSTFQGNVVLSPDGQNPFGFAAGPLVVEGPLAGPYQAIIANTLDSSVSLAGLTIGNSKFRNPGFTADYYCGFYMAAPSYNLAGLNGVMPNGGAVFCKDGPITIGSATSTAGPEIRFQATGMDSGNVDAVIEGSTGHFGIGTTSPMARLDVVGPNTSPVFQVSTSAAFATTSRLIVTAAGLVGIGTTSPLSTLHIATAGTVPQIILSNNTAGSNMRDWRFVASATTLGIGTLNEGTAASGDYAITLARETNSNDVDYIEFATNNEANKMRYTNAGSLGVGTTTPVGNGVTISAASTPQLTFADQSLAAGNKNFLMRINPTIGTGVFQIGSAVDAGSASVMAINVNRSGFVGLGTSSPARQLDVWGNMSVTSSPNDSSLQLGGSSNIAFIQAANAANNATKSLILQTSGGNVGISTTSPANKLHVYRGAGGGSLGDSTNDVLIVENSLSAAMNIITPTNASGGVFFSDNTRAVGRLNYDHTTDSMTLFTAATQRAILDSVGRFGFGTSTPIGQFNLASTSPTIVLSDTTNASHWNIANNDGVFSLSTTSSALVRTTTDALTVSNAGVVTIGNGEMATPPLVIRGGKTGTALLQLERTVGATITTSFSNAGGCLNFGDVTNSVNTQNLCGDSGIIGWYYGVRGQTISTRAPNLLSALFFGPSAGTDVAGVDFEIIGSRGTGAGRPGDLKFSTGVATASGTTQQATSTRMTISGSTGFVGIATTTPAEEFSIGGSGTATSTTYKASGTGKGHCEIWADTDGSGVTYVTANNGVLTASTVPCN